MTRIRTGRRPSLPRAHRAWVAVHWHRTSPKQPFVDETALCFFLKNPHELIWNPYKYIFSLCNETALLSQKRASLK